MKEQDENAQIETSKPDEEGVVATADHDFKGELLKQAEAMDAMTSI